MHSGNSATATVQNCKYMHCKDTWTLASAFNCSMEGQLHHVPIVLCVWWFISQHLLYSINIHHHIPFSSNVHSPQHDSAVAHIWVICNFDCFRNCNCFHTHTKVFVIPWQRSCAYLGNLQPWLFLKYWHRVFRPLQTYSNRL